MNELKALLDRVRPKLKSCENNTHHNHVGEFSCCEFYKFCGLLTKFELKVYAKGRCNERGEIERGQV